VYWTGAKAQRLASALKAGPARWIPDLPALSIAAG
jgi:hypothetical protein